MTKNRKKKRRKAPEDPPEPVAFEDMEIMDWEVKIYQAVVRREKKGGGRPDPEDTAAMEEPFRQLAGACALFGNFTTNLRPGDDIRTLGMQFMANAILLHADRLYRLYHGHAPNYD
ncbi:MAG: hypothetical protein MI755_10500 [Sphingomonadales bacterium]|nr:hypothetical protein [Sphingomonadales bacterium]